MSFGSPGGGATNVKPTPPERGSFPLDHEGECKHLISQYLKCLKLRKGVNDEECRKLAKGYLSCRMEKNLMAPDDFKNLGLVFKDEADGTAEQNAGTKS
ncbi:Cytochrome c oxidase assembly protein cox19 [Aspergillus fumigatus]|uniref:Cytochrome c oxidase assembly protein Cox19, putative n=2 Tax=Aspergillus fumigatus TaxID=746128 RepID=A4D9K0_ASPFU|nr:cytochrome c oxidase assembly protein Cox19, putative [Aspergillus fumigatus Af293]EDP56212.1 cytochrome c oxidase assembly protein Cox19, putative [Aspergillus fumigatus A1163]KAH1285298.1 Cytochrome c oxidase assembly protein cox19 [Aspergillus fumigatus]EBA27402.1 cytochrome c oxidase assembly protein Cox19, putative [Aspergillus fumigatus Af293]KAH1305570.1 Cytochrome c oxidase assembly protein cox19 [Aspergillus fumigatus]KAH1321761.1 Cytochrome c oxidase assembly protein cox19 [Asperg